MENLKIAISISKQAAITAGRTSWGTCEYSPTAEELTELTPAERAYVAAHAPNLAPSKHGRGYSDVALEAVNATWSEIVIAMRTAIAAYDARTFVLAEEARVAAAKTAVANAHAIEAITGGVDLLVQHTGRYGEPWGTLAPCDIVPGCDSDTVRADSTVSSLYAAAETEAKRRNAAKDQAEKDAEIARDDRLRALEGDRKRARDSWVADHGTVSQRARHAEGILGLEEIEAGIEADLYAWSEGLDRYDRLTGTDIDHDEVCYDASISYETSDAESATEEEYARLLTIRAIAPIGAVCTLREHIATCDSRHCRGEARRMAVHATIDWHGLAIRRQFGI